MSIYTWDYHHNDYKGVSIEIDSLEGPKPIEYRFNSLGFRSPEISDTGPCVVSFGCGHTVGNGIIEKFRYADQVAKKLNLNHYSFAANDSDCLSVVQNLNNFFKNKMHNLDVKLILVFWPDHRRISQLVNGKQKDILKLYYMDNDEESLLYKLYSTHSSYIHLLEYMKTAETLVNLTDIPLLQMSYNNLLLNGFGYKHEIDSLIYDRNLYDKESIKHLDSASFSNAWQRMPIERSEKLENFGIITHSFLAKTFYENAVIKYPKHFSKVEPVA